METNRVETILFIVWLLLFSFIAGTNYVSIHSIEHKHDKTVMSVAKALSGTNERIDTAVRETARALGRVNNDIRGLDKRKRDK